MSRMTWDDAGDRRFQTGVDRGVLYLPDGSGVPWNGITGVDEAPTQESQSFYMDGAKFLDTQTPSEFSGTLKAFTYPDEFETMLGTHEYGYGFFLHEQPPKSFCLSYRTKIGNDIDGVDAGYRIHVIYNVLASPSTMSYSSISDSATPTELSWNLIATPVAVDGFRHTSHISIDSTIIDPSVLSEQIEPALYGAVGGGDASLPTVAELLAMLDILETLTITDHGDGTWTATGPPHYFEELSSDDFTLVDVDATYLDSDTYTLSTTEPD